MVKVSVGPGGFAPGTHGSSGVFAFHRCACASTIIRRLPLWRVIETWRIAGFALP